MLLGLVFRFGMSVWCFCFGHLSFVLGFFLCWVVVMFDLPLIVLDIAYVVGLYACCFYWLVLLAWLGLAIGL